MTKVLVGYASKHGSTAEIAEAIADKLREAGLAVDCRPLRQVGTLERYDAVVLGSALYVGHWRPEAHRFLDRHAEALARRPLWVFSSGPVGEGATTIEAARVEPERIVAKVESIGAKDHVVFGGRVPVPPHGPLERMLTSSIPRQYRDRRQWGEVRAWAAGIARQLTAEDAARAV